MFEPFVFLSIDFSNFLYYLYGFLLLLLYSLGLTVVLVPFYFISEWLFKVIKTVVDQWIFDAYISSVIICLILSVFAYVFPFVFLGWTFDTFTLVETFWQWVWLFIKVILHILYVSTIFALLTMPFIFIFSLFYKWFEKKQVWIRIIFSLYITSIVLFIVLWIFPWLLGSLFAVLYL